MCSFSERGWYWVKHRDIKDARIDTVGEGEIDDAKLAGEGHRRLGAHVGEHAEPGAGPAGQDHGYHTHGQASLRAGENSCRGSTIGQVSDPL